LVRVVVAWACIVLVIAVAGCGTRQVPTSDDELHIQDLANWYAKFRKANKGRYPANEQQLATFIGNSLKQAGSSGNPQEILTSPRDGQKYTVTYGKPTSPAPNTSIVAFEKEGVDGKKLIAFETKESREIDDAELKSLLPRK